ncbi:MAG: DUF4845 domain-containing protein [Pseudohongiellaceae bacterium]|nr:DUF4845 domain-containing protein [Pseudohongiellaceae bacterium]
MKTQVSINYAQQQGFSKFGLLMTLIILISVLTFGLKVLPVYIDHNYVKNLAQELVESGDAASMTLTEVRNQIGSGLRVNNVHNFDLSAITTSRNNGEAVIEINYETRVDLVSNIDVIVSFEDRIQ